MLPENPPRPPKAIEVADLPPLREYDVPKEGDKSAVKTTLEEANNFIELQNSFYREKTNDLNSAKDKLTKEQINVANRILQTYVARIVELANAVDKYGVTNGNILIEKQAVRGVEIVTEELKRQFSEIEQETGVPIWSTSEGSDRLYEFNPVESVTLQDEIAGGAPSAVAEANEDDVTTPLFDRMRGLSSGVPAQANVRQEEAPLYESMRGLDKGTQVESEGIKKDALPTGGILQEQLEKLKEQIHTSADNTAESLQNSEDELEPTPTRTLGSTPLQRKRERRERANQMKGVEEPVLSLESTPSEEPVATPTKAEQRQTLQKTVHEVMSYSKIAEAAGAHTSVEKALMDGAEKAYLEAYKGYYQENGTVARFSKEALSSARARLGLGESEELANLSTLKNAYNESRRAYAGVIESKKKEAIAGHPVSDQFIARTRAKFDDLEKSHIGGPKASFEDFLEIEKSRRLDKIAGYIRFKEVIRPAAEKKIEAREAALGEKGQNTVEKFLSFVGKKNAELEEKYGKSEAKIIRVVATAAIATTSFGFLSAATGAALATVATAALGYGGQRVARGLFSAFAGAKVASFAGNKREISAREEKVEAEKMLTNSKYAEGLTSVKELEQYDSLREKNISTSKESTIQRKVLLRKALVGFLVGAGTTAALAELMSFLPSTEHLLENAGTGNPNTVDSTSASEVAPANTTSQIASSHTESVPSANETVPTPIPVENIGTTHIDAASIIDGKTNNADKLFGEFRSVIDLEKTIGAQTNPAVEKFLSLGKNQDSISLALGFQNEHSLSAVMHAGDRIGVVNNEVVFVNANGATHTLISADGEIHKLNMGAVHTTPPAEASSTIEHPTKTNTIEATTPVEPTLDTNPVDHVNTTVEELNRAEFEKHFATNQGANTGGIITTSTEPSLPENSSSVQTVSEVANTLPEGSFINPHNLTIDSTKPHAYLFSDTDGKPMLDVNGEKMYTIFGGKEDEPYTAAEDFLKKHPGTSVRFEVERKNILGLVTKRVLELGSTPNGAIVMHPPSVEGVPLPSPATDSFTEIDPYEFNK